MMSNFLPAWRYVTYRMLKINSNEKKEINYSKLINEFDVELKREKVNFFHG